LPVLPVSRQKRPEAVFAVRVRRDYGKSVALFRSFMLQGLYHFASFSFVVSAWIPRRSWRLLLIANFISSKLASIMSTSSTPRKKIFVFELPHDFIKIISFFFNMTLSLFVVVR
ncbi:hypothetical protein M4C12_25545, partial [Klebsiella pneumoniae]|nr:hypothetical protein [Klebsiella pneumoniae]